MATPLGTVRSPFDQSLENVMEMKALCMGGPPMRKGFFQYLNKMRHQVSLQSYKQY